MRLFIGKYYRKNLWKCCKSLRVWTLRGIVFHQFSSLRREKKSTERERRTTRWSSRKSAVRVISSSVSRKNSQQEVAFSCISRYLVFSGRRNSRSLRLACACWSDRSFAISFGTKTICFSSWNPQKFGKGSLLCSSSRT